VETESKFKVGDMVFVPSRCPGRYSATVTAVHPPEHEYDEHRYAVRLYDGTEQGDAGDGLKESDLEACPRFKVGDAVVLWTGNERAEGSRRARIKQVVERSDGRFHYALSFPDRPDMPYVEPGAVRPGYGDTFPVAQQFEWEDELQKALSRLRHARGTDPRAQDVLYVVLREVRPDLFEGRQKDSE
jgi:hypothetical protein